MDKRKKSRRELLKALGEVQHLVGQAKGDYQNDRSAERAQKVVTGLEKAFDICVEARSTDPPD